MKEFANSSYKSQTSRSVETAKIISDDVTILSVEEEGWRVYFDRKPTKVGVRGSNYVPMIIILCIQTRDLTGFCT